MTQAWKFLFQSSKCQHYVCKIFKHQDTQGISCSSSSDKFWACVELCGYRDLKINSNDQVNVANAHKILPISIFAKKKADKNLLFAMCLEKINGGAFMEVEAGLLGEVRTRRGSTAFACERSHLLSFQSEWAY